MNCALEYRYGQADTADILAHFLGCDAAFLDALRARTHLPDYASKLHARALRFEAWSGQQLAGLLAAYHDNNTRTAYISNVSVLSEYCRQGIASQMLALCLAQVRHLGLRDITLEVACDNQAAIALYRRHGFATVPANDRRILRMQLPLIHS